MAGSIAVIGDKQSVKGFRAVGFSVYVSENGADAAAALSAAAKTHSIIYITEKLAEENEELIAKYKSSPLPAIIPIPASTGGTGFGMSAIKSSVEKAVGADILFKDKQ